MRPRLRFFSSGLLLAAGAASLLLGACTPGAVRQTDLSEYYDTQTTGGVTSKMFGDQGLSMSMFSDKAGEGKDSGGALGVNAYLWRGALDTLSFMPLASADPFGGVIITDWYVPPSTPNERFKATAYILGRQLRADGVRVTVFHQVLQNGQWVDSPVTASTTGEMENKVLARARELRSQSASS
jgi:hypothetical protein